MKRVILAATVSPKGTVVGGVVALAVGLAVGLLARHWLGGHLDQPVAVAAESGSPVVRWVATVAIVVKWVATVLPVLPGLAVAVYAATQWRRSAMSDAWSAMWLLVSEELKDADGKVTEKAALRGTHLVRPRGQRRLVQEVYEDGMLREIVLRVRIGRGHLTVDHVAKAAGVIAKAFLTYRECVTVTAASHHGEAEVRITMAAWADRQAAERQARVGALIVWERPSLDPAAGTVELGQVVTDWSPARVDIWTPSWGARRIWMAGESGSGKTYGLNDLLLDSCSAGIVVPHVIDLEDGPTLAGWERMAASYATTIDGALDVWRALLAEHEARKPLLKQLSHERGLDVIPPSREHPMHLLVVDGGPRAVRHEEFMTCTRVAAFEWRKFMLGLVWVSQPGTADVAFGKGDRGGTALRDQFNVRIGFRAGSETSRAMFNDDHLLPSISVSTPGVAYLQSPSHPDPVPIKTKFQHDPAGLRGKWTDIPAWERPASAPPAPAWGPAEEWRRPASAGPVDSGERAVVRDDVPEAGDPGYLRDPDPEARIRGVLRERGPQTAGELVDATRLSKTRVYDLLPRMSGVVKSVKYGGRWSLEQEVGR